MINPIVSSHWLDEHRHQVALCDVRPARDGIDGAQMFLAGHLPGAVFVDPETVLSSDAGPVVGRHPLPSPSDFAAAFGELGIGPDATVVAYDDLGGAYAGRLVWMLRVLGQSAALLDGGLGLWPGALEEGPVTLPGVDRPVVPWPMDALADAEEVSAVIADGGSVIDSRAHARYIGEMEPIDAIAGHIPGAHNVPFADNLDESGRFRPNEVLRARFEAVGADEAAIVYCGSGVTACHNAIAMEAAGLGRPRLYVGSWSGWSTDPERPIATGDEP